MAKRTSTSGSSRPRPSAMEDVGTRAVRAGLDLAAEGLWRNVTLADVAERAGVAVTELCRVAPTKSALAGLFMDDVDRQVLDGGPTAAEDGIRHRLFDLLMRRFDALNQNRAGVLGLLRDGRGDPALVLGAAGRLLRSMAMTLEAAGVSASGLRGFARVQGLAAVYGYALRTWLRDDSPDMAATMAALDKALATAGVVAARIPGQRPTRHEPAVPPDGPATA